VSADDPAQVSPTLATESARAAPLEVIEAQPEVEVGVQVSRRPQARPREIEEAAARPSPAPERRETRSRSRQGNTATRDATRGSVVGTEAATATQQGRDTARRSDDQGNAAASNYPGEVMRHLARVPRPRAASRGAALVQFSIAAGGGLASVGLARSSGSSRLDRAALTVIERAAPFPAPPAGAQRRFSVRIEGR
jgi:protein TonB